MLIKPLSTRPSHPALPLEVPALRRGLAVTLRAASRLLQRMAQQLAATPARSLALAPTPLLEFHAEAGAPEGALYVDGVLLGHLAGVRRL